MWGSSSSCWRLSSASDRTVPGHHGHQWSGHHPLSWWMGSAVFLPHLDTFLCVVLPQAAGAYLRLHLDSRHAPPSAHGPADEFRLGIHPPHGLVQYACRRRLALYAARNPALAGLHCHGCDSVHPAEHAAEAQKEVATADLSICRMIWRSIMAVRSVTVTCGK